MNVTGIIDYHVRVKCPHCNTSLDLSHNPYTDEESPFGKTEDELGMAVFGTPTQPAQWVNIDIGYKCVNCEEDFTLTEIEY